MGDQKIRVRFAPSPTGPLHIGGVRTALYNYLFARKHGGDFILRIEDTDRNRYVEGAEQYIIEAFKWCGIQFDEGVNQGGSFGPYRQSERKEHYKSYAIELVQSGHAYYAFDPPESLEEARKSYEKQKLTFTYNAKNRNSFENSLTLTKTEVENLISSGKPYVVRFKMPEDEEVVMQDLIRGTVKVNASVLDDKILFKSDGMPTYHLANIVDDHLMEISHVIRGEEWLPSLPLHVKLYESYGWTPPQFAHLPLLLKPEGGGKLSKRDGDRLGFPVFPIEWTDPVTKQVSSGYREEGYLPEAFINMIAFLGWNPGDDREFMTMDELVETFTIERVGKSGARFDPEKARWYNHHYIATMPDRLLSELFIPILKQNGLTNPEILFVEKVVGLVKERINFVRELWDQSYYFFIPPADYDPKAVKKRWKASSYDDMNKLKAVIEVIDDFSSTNVEKVVKSWITKHDLSMGAIMNAFRLLIVGALRGPHLFDILELIGKDETMRRLETGINTLGQKEIPNANP